MSRIGTHACEEGVRQAEKQAYAQHVLRHHARAFREMDYPALKQDNTRP